MIIKNSNLRRILFVNRYKILAIIIAIILCLYLIQVMNENAKEKMEKESQIALNRINTQTSYNPSETIVSGKDVSEEQQKINSEIIDEFINYCNNKEIEKAYNLLTDECKERVFFSKIEYFEQNYINKIFNTQKSYTIQSWVSSNGYTYKIEIYDDILSSGKISTHKIEDYYTLIKQNGTYKLNINEYIQNGNINRYSEKDGVKIEILNKDVYKSHETYKIKVYNNTDTTIMLDTKQDTDSIYLQGTNDKHYSAFMYEVDETRLIIKPGYYTTLSINFNKLYSTSIKMQYMVFTDIVKDYDTYKQLTNKNDYKDKLDIKIEL